MRAGRRIPLAARVVRDDGGSPVVLRPPRRRHRRGRRGRAYGWISALSSVGIVVGATVASQPWARTGVVGLGLLTTAIGHALVIGFLLLSVGSAGRAVIGD